MGSEGSNSIMYGQRFFASSTSQPIHMYTADPLSENKNGELVSSFIGHNHFDEIDHAYSVCAVDNVVIGGYSRSNAKVFDINRPGR